MYGFRHLQSLVRAMKAGTCPYDYVEVMACPSGCVNGGGQVRVGAPRPHAPLPLPLPVPLPVPATVPSASAGLSGQIMTAPPPEVRESASDSGRDIEAPAKRTGIRETEAKKQRIQDTRDLMHSVSLYTIEDSTRVTSDRLTHKVNSLAPSNTEQSTLLTTQYHNVPRQDFIKW
jgi:hypothetical protein